MDLVIDGVRWVLWILVKGNCSSSIVYITSYDRSFLRYRLKFSGVAMVGHPDDVHS